MPNAAKPFVVGTGESRSTRKLGGVSGTKICVKFSANDTDNQFTVLELPTEAGRGPPLHVHHIEDEWFFVLDGEHEFQVAGDRFRVAPGASIFAPRLIPHTWRNVSARPGKMLCIASRPAAWRSFSKSCPFWRLPTPLMSARERRYSSNMTCKSSGRPWPDELHPTSRKSLGAVVSHWPAPSGHEAIRSAPEHDHISRKT